ncbi:MAG: AAA family ATPase [Sphingomonadaceae bacterium]|nr:AAA family ATPase [Sphingomonadaceae bacterium]
MLDKMKAARRWLIWQSIVRPGKSKPDKVPFYAGGTPRGATDTPADLVRLVTYDEAREAVSMRGDSWGMGFALGPDGDGGFWQGIDLDNICENRLVDLDDALPGYVETSPSGKGLHAIGYGRHFAALGSNGSGIEAYSGGRFFTFTGNKIRDGEIVCIADHVENALAPLHRAKALNPSPAAKASAAVQVSAQTVADLRSALNHMRSDDYGFWIEMGHALKPLGDTGRGLWLDWSATSPKYDPQEAARKWDSFYPQHTGYQAVFARAQANGWINPASNASIFATFAEENSPNCITASPFIAPAIPNIPPRPWLLGRWLLRGAVTTLIAPGGTGKSALMVATALSLASGRELLGKTVWGGPKRVWLWNLEDDRDELARQFTACLLHHNIEEWEYGDRLFVNDAGSSLCTATKGRDGLVINEPVNAALVSEIRARRIDVLIVDPFVSSHRGEENDNGQMDAIAKRWASIARDTGCSIILVHHSRKLGGQQVDAEAARGASALGNAARSVLVLNRMDNSEASRLGIGNDDRRRYFRVSNDKTNRAPAEAANWFHLASVKLGNGGLEGGDSVGVVERWAPPEIALTFGDDVRAKIQAEIASGEWRTHPTAKDWAGYAVAKIIGADISVPAGKKQVAALLKDMNAKDQLRSVQRLDASRHMRDFTIVGEQVGEMCGSPAW